MLETVQQKERNNGNIHVALKFYKKPQRLKSLLLSPQIIQVVSKQPNKIMKISPREDAKKLGLSQNFTSQRHRAPPPPTNPHCKWLR